MRFTTDNCGRTIVDRGMGYVSVPAPGGLGNCFTGSCADGLAPYGWMSPPCGLTPEQGASWGAAQMIVSQGRPLQGPAPTPVPQAWNGQPVVNAKAGVFRPRAPRGFLKAA